MTTTDSADKPVPLKDATVVVEVQGSAKTISTTTGDDGTTTNNGEKFEFGTKVTITVTLTGYFAKKQEHEFKDTEKDEQEHMFKLTKEGKDF